MPEVDETIITQIIVITDEAIRNTQEFRKAVDATKAKIKADNAETGLSFKDLGQGIKDELGKATNIVDEFGRTVGKNTDVIKRGNLVTSQAVRELNEESRTLGGTFSNLGSISKFVFGSILGVSALGVLRKIIDLFKSATEAAIEFTRATFKLEIAVRGLQRAGLDITLAEFRQVIEDIQAQFPIFSEQDVTAAVAQAGLLQREFKFTSEKIQELTLDAAILSEITGKTLLDSLTQVSFFLNTGWARSLRKMGVNISDATVQNEAFRMGIEKDFDSLDQTTKAMVRLAVVTKGLSAIQEDAGKIVDTTSGKQQVLTTTFENFKKELGERTLPVWEGFLVLLTDVIRAAEIFVDALTEVRLLMIEGLLLPINAVGFAATMMWKSLSGEEDFSIDQFLSNLREAREGIRETLRGITGLADEELLGDLLGKKAAAAAARAEEALTKFNQAFSQLKEEILEIEKRKDKAIIDERFDFVRDMEAISLKFLRREKELWLEHTQSLLDIINKAMFSIADAQRKAVLDRTQIGRQFDQRMEDANRKHRQKEIDAEKKFQEKLRQLRENFLLSLEDAIRSRDAAQISRLRRRFSIDQARLKRQAKDEKKSRDDSFEDQKRSLRQQREERLRVLKEELDFRIQQILINRDREIAAEKLKHAQQKAELEKSLEEQRNARELKHNETLVDMDRQFREDIELIAEKLGEQFDITEEFAEKIRRALEAEFGKGGATEAIFNALADQIVDATDAVEDSVARIIKIIEDIKKAYGQVRTEEKKSGPPPVGDGQGGPPERGEGGTFFARKPTLAIFGDKGPEMATFTPVGRTGANVGRVFGGSVGGRKQQIELFIGLQEGLFAEVVNTTLGEVADVIVKVQRSR